MIDWKTLESEEQLEQIAASGRPSLIFKHSTRCGVSSMAKRRIAQDTHEIPEAVDKYYLDLIRYRVLSDEIARIWQVRHESPQVLLVQGHECLHHASHGDIDIPEALATLAQG